jgi:6-phosphogluconate dehydrogenase
LRRRTSARWKASSNASGGGKNKAPATCTQPADAAHTIAAETTPLRDPDHYQYDLNLPDITELWRRGSVIASWLLDLTASALAKDNALSGFAGRVSDSGEGRWTIKAAIDEAVPAHVLTAALYERFSSRGEADFANRVLSAMRYEFGGHIEKSAG